MPRAGSAALHFALLVLAHLPPSGLCDVAGGAGSVNALPGGGGARLAPSFDAATPRNVTALVGKSAYLSCRVRNLGNRTVVDIESRIPLGPNKPGEICVKGPLVMKGYVGKDNNEIFDSEGFFTTGDVGYYDEDKRFFIVDRLKELIKYKGYQVAPAELEGLLLKHDGVRDAGVVGIPDPIAGEVPLAFVVKQPDMNVTEEELKKFVAERLSNPKQLRGGVRFVSAIPKNPSGKILRKDLRKMVKEAKSKL